MDKVAVFIEHYTIGNSPSIINLLDLLSERYKVDLYLRHVGLKNADILKKRNINVIEVSEEGSIGCSRGGLIDFINYKKDKIKAIFSSYKSYICVDPHGFVLCKALFPKSRPIYYSLELYMKNDHFGLYYPQHVMRKERDQIHDIKGLIIQSEEKESLFRKDYNLSEKIPSFILPVTYKGASVKEKSSKLRDKYGIGSDKKIALHLGGIADWFSCEEIALAFSKLRNWVLFFQGHPDRNYLEKLKNTLQEYSVDNVIISEEVYDSLEDVDHVIMSCDLGIAWYNDLSIGFRTAGKSSGKISAYLKFGLPVIAKKYQSTLEAIENTGCGICVDDFNQIPDAVAIIEKDYNKYSRNAFDEYDKTYRFDNYTKELIAFIDG